MATRVRKYVAHVPRVRRRAMLEIAKALAPHASHALPLACGAAQPSPPHLPQRGRARSGRQPVVQSTCRRCQNVSARTCERTRDTARFIAKAACSHRVHVRLLARAPAPSSPLQPGWGTCEARRLTSALTHAHTHASQQALKSRAPHAAAQPKGAGFAPETFAAI